MYGTLALSHRALQDLVPSAGERSIDEIRSLARPIEGLRILNLSVTGFGTGTAELLNSTVPLLNDLGLDAHWQVVRASSETAAVTRAMYRALGGLAVEWTQEMTNTWLSYAAMNGELLTEKFDVIVVHDPQPLAMRSYNAMNDDSCWVAHSHLDLSSASEQVWLPLRRHLEQYDAAIFDAESFARDDLTIPTKIVPPAIDPNSARNMELSSDVIVSVLEQYGIDPQRPLITQVSPIDEACDLVGVFETWELVREEHPDVQLALVLFTEPQDAAGQACYDELVRRSKAEGDVFVITPAHEIGNVEINVFQTAATVVLQKGLRKGFGMWVADALWKRRPCVVAPEPGLCEQVIDGETGLVAKGTQETAAAISRLLKDRELAEEFGERGRQRVAERFLITRYLRDYLQILTELHGKSA